MARRTKQPAPRRHRTTEGSGAAPAQKLTPAQLSRLQADAKTGDLFEDELSRARVRQARDEDTKTRRYEAGKVAVNRKSKGKARVYEGGIRALVKRIRY